MVLFTSRFQDCSKAELWELLLNRREFFAYSVCRYRSYFERIMVEEENFITFCMMFISCAIKQGYELYQLSDILEESISEFVSVIERNQYKARQRRRRYLTLDEDVFCLSSPKDPFSEWDKVERMEHFKACYFARHIQEEDLAIADELFVWMLTHRSSDDIALQKKFREFIEKYPRFCYTYPKKFGRYLRKTLQYFYRKKYLCNGMDSLAQFPYGLARC